MREKSYSGNKSWHDWSVVGGARRVDMIGSTSLDVQAMAYHLPPVTLNSEVELQVPCSAADWDASGPREWQLARDRVIFQDGVSVLIDKTHNSAAQRLLSRLSPLANLIFSQALIQRLRFYVN